jgi:hypothetical protein
MPTIPSLIPSHVLKKNSTRKKKMTEKKSVSTSEGKKKGKATLSKM